MSKANRSRTALAPEAATEDVEAVTWTDVHALAPSTVITAKDRLHLFAGDGEEGDEAPASIRHNPEALLEWCRRYQPGCLLSDETALVNATNRTHTEFMRPLRKHDPKRRWIPADALTYLLETE